MPTTELHTPSLPHAITLRARIRVDQPKERVYRFLVREMPSRYCELAAGHERFDVEGGGPLKVGSVIDCRERAGNQEIRHRYVVRRLEPDLVHYVSAPSHTRVHAGRRVIDGEVGTHVTYAISEDGDRTEVAMTIAIVFPNRLALFVGRVLGRTASLWGAHQQEELRAMRDLLACPSQGSVEDALTARA